MSHQIRRAVAAVISVCWVMTSTSCSTFVRIPPREYEQRLQASEIKHYRVRTRDDGVYAVARLSATDSTLVIEEFDRSEDAVAGMTSALMPVPYALDLDDVSSVEIWVKPKKSDAVLLTGVTIAALVTIAYWLVGLGWKDSE